MSKIKKLGLLGCLFFVFACSGIDIKNIDRPEIDQIAGNVTAGIIAGDIADENIRIIPRSIMVLGYVENVLNSIEGQIIKTDVFIESVFEILKTQKPDLKIKEKRIIALCKEALQANIGDIQVTLDPDYHRAYEIFKEIVQKVHMKLSALEKG